ncbi:glycoside hydrolase family protein [Pseudomonas lurida]|uniref:glycoside hydrolase family protein n=1 Tax=Pseudomonas lurida TaxID=244566 RepID=UPI0017805AA6|nr:hypothetical protein [Pseudomonas lurida]MBD8671650.1 hypothetical protein [Pseudomonas lurida]
MTARPTQQQVSSTILDVGKRNKKTAVAIALALSVAATEGTRLTVYDDGLGIPTVCMGKTGKDVQFGQPARTLPECAQGLFERLETNHQFLVAKLPVIKTSAGPIGFEQLTEGEQQAYNLLLDNLGTGKKGVKDGLFALKVSGEESTMMKLLRQGRRREACAQIMQWLKPKWMPGIEKRRTHETALCLRDLGPV